MTPERAREILKRLALRAVDPTDYVEQDISHEDCDALDMGAQAIAEVEELLDALEAATFPDRMAIEGPLGGCEIRVVDLLVKHGRVTKTDTGYEWSPP